MTHDDMTWKAAMSSEIFREYAANEAARMKKEAELARFKEANREQEELALMEQFATLEMEIKDSPKKLQAFKILKEKFASDQAYAAKAHPLFVKAVMMLKLD